MFRHDGAAWRAPGAALRGVAAALLSARWVRGRRFGRMLRYPEAGGSTPAGDLGRSASEPAADRSDAAGTLEARAAESALRVLERLPLSPWRSTCLYRSVARCLLLRWRGVAARVRLGARRPDDGSRALAAHAWVEVEGEAAAVPERPAHTPFRGAGKLRARPPDPPARA